MWPGRSSCPDGSGQADSREYPLRQLYHVGYSLVEQGETTVKRIIVALCLVALLYGLLNMWQEQPGKTASLSSSLSSTLNRVMQSASRQSSSTDVEGKPTLSAAFIDKVLAAFHSRAAGTGEALYSLGVQYGIDPAYALAFFMHESTFGTTGVARATLSLGNIRCTPGYQCIEGYRAYASYQNGYLDWYRLIRNLYITQWHLTTVQAIIPVYAPSSDHNDVASYIAAIERAVRTWRAGEVRS